MKRMNLLTLRTILPPVVVVIFSLVLAACAPSPVPPGGTPAAPAAGETVAATPGRPAATPAAETASTPNPGTELPETGSSSVLVADNPEFGQILVTADGMTLYTFAIDTPGVSNCTTSGCVTFWPPATVEAQPSAGPGVPGMLSTLTRSDGSMQVTYNGSPLYTFALDKNPGDAKGDGVNEFGGIWHVVSVASAGRNTSE